MSKRTLTLLFVLLLALPSAAHASAAATRGFAAIRLARASFFGATDREQDGLAGPVRRVKTETAKIAVKNGKPVEGPRVPLETTTYDMKGTRVDNAYFLAAGGSLTGKEVYKYDDRGNIVEMTLHNDDGSLLSKETYAYEFDAVGNWVKMTTSVAVIEGGKVTFEPSEVTYRTISYYLDEAMMAKMAQPSPQPSASPAASPAASAPAPANLGAQAAQPKAAEKSPAVANNNQQQQQPAAKKDAPKGSTAAPVLLASLDKANVVNPTLTPVASSNSTTSGSGPSVKSDGDAAPVARPAQRAPVKPISGGILNGRALSLPPPTYPDMARRARTMGTVEVEVVIDVTGKVISAKAVKGPGLLQGAAEQAAKQAKFTPTLLSGQPVKISGVITYNFNLQ